MPRAVRMCDALLAADRLKVVNISTTHGNVSMAIRRNDSVSMSIERYGTWEGVDGPEAIMRPMHYRDGRWRRCASACTTTSCSREGDKSGRNPTNLRCVIRRDPGFHRTSYDIYYPPALMLKSCKSNSASIVPHFPHDTTKS